MSTRPSSDHLRSWFHVAMFAVALAAAFACSSTTTTGTGAPSPGAPAPGSSAPGATSSVGGTAPAKVAAGSITVAAAASLTDPFKAIGAAFEQAHPGTHVAFTFDSSATLSQQIADGAPVDVFASADQANMTKLDGGTRVGPPRVFAKNKLAIVVKKGNPTHITSVADLAGASTISLCGPDVPCGKYADQILRTAGVTVPTDHITRGQNAKATLTAVADGDADAGIVYVTDIKGDKVDAVTIPDEQNVVAEYPIVVIAATHELDLARAFVAFVLGPDGQGALRGSGFLGP